MVRHKCGVKKRFHLCETSVALRRSGGLENKAIWSMISGMRKVSKRECLFCDVIVEVRLKRE